MFSLVEMLMLFTTTLLLGISVYLFLKIKSLTRRVSALESNNKPLRKETLEEERTIDLEPRTIVFAAPIIKREESKPVLEEEQELNPEPAEVNDDHVSVVDGEEQADASSSV